MANIKDILNYCRDAATVNGYSYRLVRGLADVNAISGNNFPMVCVLAPVTESGYKEKATHNFTLFVLDKVPKVTQDTVVNTNDRYHAEYKALDDVFNTWHSSLVGTTSNGLQVFFTEVGSDIEVTRLRDGQTNEEVLGIQVTFELITTWYCGDVNADIPSGGGSCDPATVLNADGSSYLTVASGGSVQLTGVEITGNTPSTGVQNDGNTFDVSGVTIAGNTPATGVQDDGSTFTVSGVTVNDDGVSTTYDDGSTVNIFRNGWSVLLDGINQYAEVTGVNDFNFEYDDAFSVEFWVRNDGLAFATYVSNYNRSTTQGWRVVRSGTGSNRGGINFQIGNGSINYRVTTNSTSLLTEGLWHHVVVCKPTNNNANNASIYVDGVSVPFTVLDTGGTGAFTHNNGLWLGTDADVDIGTLDARFDSLAVYNRELSAAEALAHYNNGRPTDRSGDSGLVGYWRFENDFTDETVASNDLTAFNSPTFSRQRP